MILYKYLPPDRIDVLQGSLIRYTQPGAFNDPFETKPYITQISEEDNIEETIDQVFHEEVVAMYEGLAAEVKAVFSFDAFLETTKKQRESMRGQFEGIVNQFTPLLRRTMDKKINELLGILSLTEKPSNLLMWSHYAQSHEGFVVGFDSSHEYFDQRKSENDELRHLRKVSYRSKRPQTQLTDMEGVDVFLVKSTEWEYEQEWRIMRPLSDAAITIPSQPYPVCLFEYPKDTIKEIYLGARMLESYRQTMLKLINDSEELSQVRIFQSAPAEKEFTIATEEIHL